jgi:hypothetical protein
MTLLIDASTGTVLTAETCYLLPDDALTEAEWEALDSSSDSECSAMARERGRSLLIDSAALDAVAELLSSEQWSSDHIEAVADMIRATGRTIADC